MEEQATYAPTAPESLPPVPEEEVAPVSEEGEDSETPEEEEPAQGEEPADEEPKRKLTAQERIQQLANQKNELKAELERERARLDRIEQELQAKAQPQPEPDFIEITPAVMNQINGRLAALNEAKTEAELKGDYFSAVQAQKEIDAIYSGYQENQRRFSEAQQKQQAEADRRRMVEQTSVTFNVKAEQFRQAMNIPPDVWQAGGDWFAQQCSSNPVVGNEFIEIHQRQGETAAIRHAYNYYLEHGPHNQVAEKTQQKEAAKAKTVGGGQKPVSTNDDLRDDMPISEWMQKYNERRKR